MAKPKLVAHRGGTGLWPENTLEAFVPAMDLGSDGIEIDVHLTRDGVPVVHHDESLKPAIARGQDGQWLERPTPRLKDLDYAVLRHYDVGRLKPGSRYGARFPEQKPFDAATIPRLDDVYYTVKSHGKADFHIYVELKTAILDLTQSATPEALADAVVKLTRQIGMGHRVSFVSFDWRALMHAKKLAPEIANAFTTNPFFMLDPNDPSAKNDVAGSEEAQLRARSAAGADWYGGADWRAEEGPTFAAKMLKAMAKGGAEGWFAWHGDVTQETVTLAKSLGLKVSAWTVDEPQEMQRLIDLGIDAILTDRPDRLKTQLG